MSDTSGSNAPVDGHQGIFRPAWFGRLLRAELGLGDTFWAGNFGVALIFMPVGFLAALIAMIALSDAGAARLMGGLSLLLALYQIALTWAMFRVARRTPQAGIWRWIGLALTALIVVLHLYTAKTLLGAEGSTDQSAPATEPAPQGPELPDES